MRKYLKIKPLDTLFFRGGHPFSKGQENWVNSQVLPNPSVIWGAIFSMLYANDLVEKRGKNKNGEKRFELSEKQKLKLGKIYLFDDSNVWLPAPFDLFHEKNSTNKISIAKEVNDETVITKVKFSRFGMPETEIKSENIKGRLIDLTMLRTNYFQEDNISLKELTDESIISKEFKVGIARNNHSRTTEEGLLYQIELTRLVNQWSFLVEIEFDGNFPKKGMMKLGGERKAAAFEVLDNLPLSITNFETAKVNFNIEGSFKLIFCAPTFFDSGVGINELKCDFFDPYLVFSDKAQSIGGFDYDERKPKWMRKAVPAGSVYYLDNIKELSYNEVCQKLTEIIKPDYRGFGNFEVLPFN